MSQNLDPDAIDKLNESFRELNHSMPSFILGINQILGVASGSVKASDALKNLSKSTKELTAMQEAQAQTDEKMDAIKANRERAQTQATESLKKFALGLTSTTTEFSTFGKAVSGAGDAALAWGKNLGLLGLTIGVLIKATTLAAEAAMKQADNVLKAKDELSKMGVAGGMTAKSLLEMGHAAGYSSEKLGVIVKASKTMGTDIMALGGNVKQSMKAFGDMTKVGNDVYSSFQRLGVSQEELTENQADYVKLQVASGRMITEQMKRDGSLKAASLEYTKNLLELSAITGMSMNDAKKAKETAQANFDIAMHTTGLEEEKQKLLATGNAADKEKAAQIDKELKANSAMLEAAVATKDAQFIAATQSRIATGAWTDTSTVLLRTLPNFEELQKGLREGTISQGDYVKAIAEGTQRQRQNLKGAAVFDKEMAEKQGLSLAMQQNSAKVLGKDIPAALKEAQTDIKNATEGKGTGSGTDPAEIARNTLTEFSRTISVGLDKLLGKASPLIEGFTPLTMATTALTAAALAAALYLGKMAAQAKIISTLEAAKNIGGAGGPGGGKGDGGYDPKTPPKDGHYKDEKGRWRDSSGKYSKGPPVETTAPTKAPGAAGKAMGILGKLAGPAAGLLAVGAGAMNATEGYNDAEDKVKKGEITKEEGTVKKSEAVGKGVGEGLGGAGGAALGAAIGTFIFPVVGTAIGAAFGGWLGSMGGEAIGESVGNTVGKELAKKPVVATAAAKASAKETGSSGSSTPVAMGNEGRRGSPSSAPVASSAPATSASPTPSTSAPKPTATATMVATASPKPSGSDGSGATEKVSTGDKAPPKAMAKAGGSMSDEDIKKMIIKHEGIRNKPYKDSLGLWTVGVGHLIGNGYKGQAAPPAEWNREFSNEEVMKMFDEDYAHHKSAAMNIPGYDKVNSKGQGALTDLTFNMGPNWISKWPKLKKQLGEGDTQSAASNLQESKWFGQVGNRAPTIVSLLKDSSDSKVSASLEGIAEGPESGYDATLHGTEIIKRLTKDSILDKLANTPAGDMFSNNTSGQVDNSEMIDLMKEFLEKMDDLISAQSDSNSIQNELLQYSKV